MKSKRSIFEKACKRCLVKKSIKKEDDNFLKLDFQLKKCKTNKCRKFYKSKIRSLVKKSRKRRSRKRRSRDGFFVEFPVKPYNTCKVWKGF